MFASTSEWDYGWALEEIAGLGATHANLLVAYSTPTTTSLVIEPRSGLTPSQERLRTTIRQAHAHGLQVLLFPVVLVEHPAHHGEWRGVLDPPSLDAWFAAYGDLMEELARLAEEENVAWFSLGSEYKSLERQTAHWKALIARVRSVYGGRLIYTANWDQPDGPAGWWQDLDAAGLSSYFEITGEGEETTPAALRAGWRRAQEVVLRWQRDAGLQGMPLIFTELGYPSVINAAHKPWFWQTREAPAPEEQRKLYEAFIATWDGRPELHGVFFYKWISFDADDSRSYSPRGKPAESVLRRWYGGQ